MIRVSLVLSWVLFPLVLGAVGAGWGVAVERASGMRLTGALVVPLGLAAAIVAASLLTAWSVTAAAAVPVVGVVAVAGLLILRPVKRLTMWPALAALGVLAAYGAPVLLSGTATFAGYLRLDDSASWMGITDHVMSHGRSLADLPPSTYRAALEEYVTNSYPLGSFMLLGIGHAFTTIDTAWIYQPYLACCAAAVGLGVYALTDGIVRSPSLRALVAFFAAQPALLYGYAMWGGIKELTAAFVLVLGAALLAQVIASAPASPRRLLPLAVAAAALIATLGVGAAGWVLPALACVVIVWVLRGWRGSKWPLARDIGVLTAVTAVLAIPMWVVLSSFLNSDGVLFTSGLPVSEQLGNLFQPLSVWQLVGIWPIGDFRLLAPTTASAPLVALALLSAGVAIWLTVRLRQFTIVAYVALALAGCAVFYLVGSTPWVVAKALAIASPAILAAALTGGALLWIRRRWAGLLVLLGIGGGVLWSNALAYHDVTLAPRAPLAELQKIGELVAHKGPTFVNVFEAYAARHFLRQGAPIEPAQYRPYNLPLNDGATLTKAAWADIDSFPMSTLEPYRSIVTRSSPAESRPPSIYRLAWQGRYYQLWVRPAHPRISIVKHVPLGESNTLPYCGNAINAPARQVCSINPVSVPPCTQVRALGREARADHAELVAYERPDPIAVRADEGLWPAGWVHNGQAHALTPTRPGTATFHIAVPRSQNYELWLDGEFSRGFEVTVDGVRRAGRVKDELAGFGASVDLADLPLRAGVHAFALTYPHADLTPGSGENELTSLSTITLQPEGPASEPVTVAPAQAATLCGRTLDWIEIARKNGS